MRNDNLFLRKYFILLVLFIYFFLSLSCFKPTSEELLNAVKSGDVAAVESMIKAGVDVNIYDKYGYSILHLAILAENEEMVKTMIQNKINLEIKDEDRRGFTALMIAVEKGNYNIVKLLIDSGANIYPECKIGFVPLLDILPWRDGFNLQQIAEYLIEKGLDVNERDQYGMTPLHYAVSSGKYDYTKYLLEHGADPNIADNNDNLPIMFLSYLTKTYAEGDKISDENIILSHKIEALLNQYMKK